MTDTPKPGSLRATMPQTAAIVDWLRAELGKDVADRIVLKGRRGDGGFYAAEIGPDGVMREFGSSGSGARVVVKADGGLGWTGRTEQ